MKYPMFQTLLCLAATLLLSQSGYSQSSSTDDAELDSLRIRLTQSLEVASANQLQIVSLKRSAMANIVEVEISTGEILYSDIGGEFLFAGDMFQASPAGLVNLSSKTRQVRTQELVSAIPESEMIIFKPQVTKASITVFTDVDCTYCRALHRDLEKLNDLGIEVKYAAYPRGGEQADSYDKMISVWCSEDRKKSLTQAKNGQNLPKFECDNPVLEHYAIGNAIGISGTPAIVLPDGQVVPGYMDSERLAALLAISD
jgi:thiol:disulfide interchange protein DsbC